MGALMAATLPSSVRVLIEWCITFSTRTTFPWSHSSNVGSIPAKRIRERNIMRVFRYASHCRTGTQLSVDAYAAYYALVNIARERGSNKEIQSGDGPGEFSV